MIKKNKIVRKTIKKSSKKVQKKTQRKILKGGYSITETDSGSFLEGWIKNINKGANNCGIYTNPNEPEKIIKCESTTFTGTYNKMMLINNNVSDFFPKVYDIYKYQDSYYTVYERISGDLSDLFIKLIFSKVLDKMDIPEELKVEISDIFFIKNTSNPQIKQRSEKLSLMQKFLNQNSISNLNYYNKTKYSDIVKYIKQYREYFSSFKLNNNPELYDLFMNSYVEEILNFLPSLVKQMSNIYIRLLTNNLIFNDAQFDNFGYKIVEEPNEFTIPFYGKHILVYILDIGGLSRLDQYGLNYYLKMISNNFNFFSFNNSLYYDPPINMITFSPPIINIKGAMLTPPNKTTMVNLENIFSMPLSRILQKNYSIDIMNKENIKNLESAIEYTNSLPNLGIDVDIISTNKETVEQIKPTNVNNTRRAEQNARRAEQNARRAEENARRAEENARRANEKARRANENARRMEENARHAEENARRAIENARRAEENARLVSINNYQNVSTNNQNPTVIPTVNVNANPTVNVNANPNMNPNIETMLTNMQRLYNNALSGKLSSNDLRSYANAINKVRNNNFYKNDMNEIIRRYGYLNSAVKKIKK